jgi:hypothetical protein
MVIYSVAIIFLLFSTIQIATYKGLKDLKREIMYLPKRNTGNPFSEIIKTGVNFMEYVYIEPNKMNEINVIVLGAASCSHCHDSIETIIAKRKSNVNYIYLLVNERDDKTNDFIAQYGEDIEIALITGEQRDQMGIKALPTYIRLNKNGFVMEISGNTLKFID